MAGLRPNLPAQVSETPSPQWGPMLLLRAVREVADRAGVEEPERITQRAWDAARDSHELWRGAPAARRIAERLGLSWPQVRVVAYTNAAMPESVYAHKTREHDRGWLTPDYVVFALRLVARHLEVETMWPHEYTVEREALLAADHKRWKHGRQLRLPSVDQVRKLTDTWEQALELAGLAPLPEVARFTAPTVSELLDRCYDAHGTQPSCHELRRFARANRIPFPQLPGKWNDLVAEWKASRRERGLPVPDRPPPLRERPDYGADVGAGRPGERRRADRSDRDECVAWVAKYLRSVEPGKRPGVIDYRQWRRQNPDAPAFESLLQHGGWRAVRQDAERLVLEAATAR